jgi:hypothetical protein
LQAERGFVGVYVHEGLLHRCSKLLISPRRREGTRRTDKGFHRGDTETRSCTEALRRTMTLAVQFKFPEFLFSKAEFVRRDAFA